MSFENDKNFCIKRLVITINKDEERKYNIDIDENSKFKEIKSIIRTTAKLFKNTFTLRYKNIELGKSYDKLRLYDIKEFEEQNQINLDLILDEECTPIEIEEETQTYKIKLDDFCEIHGKKKLFFCTVCQESICIECSESLEHYSHEVEEKADLLMNSDFIINKLFSNKEDYVPDKNKSKQKENKEYINKLEKEIFLELNNSINAIQSKCINSLKLFEEVEKKSYNKCLENIELFKEYSKENFIALKNDIDIEKVLTDDNIYVTLRNKLNDLNNYKNDYLENNLRILQEINEFWEPFKQTIFEMITKIKDLLEKCAKMDIFDSFSNHLNKKKISYIEKSEVSNILFKDINVRRKTLDDRSYKKKCSNYTSFKKAGFKRSSVVNQFNFSDLEKMGPNPFLEKSNQNKTELKNDKHKVDFDNNKNEEIKEFNFRGTFNNDLIGDDIFIGDLLPQDKNKKNEKNEKVDVLICICPVLNENRIRYVNQNLENFLTNINLKENSNTFNVFPENGAYCNKITSNYYKLFFSGGTNGNEYSEKNLYELRIRKKDTKDAKLFVLNPTLYPHTNHSMISNNESDEIIIVGGLNSNRCEKIDTNQKIRTKLSDLNEKERQRPMLYIENNILYVFMGYNSKNIIIDTVEKLDMKNRNNKFEYVNYKNSFGCNLNFFGAGIYRLKNKNTLLFLGGKGYDEKYEIKGFNKNLVEYDLENDSFNYFEHFIDYKKDELYFIENKLHKEDDQNNYGNFSTIKNAFYFSINLPY